MGRKRRVTPLSLAVVSLVLSFGTAAQAQRAPVPVHIDAAPVDDAVIEGLVHRRLIGGRGGALEVLNSHLARAVELLGELEADEHRGNSGDAIGTRMLLAAALHEARATRSDVRDEIERQRAAISAAGGDVDAFDQLIRVVDSGFDELLSNLDDVAGVRGEPGRALGRARDAIDRLFAPGQHHEPVLSGPIPTFTLVQPATQPPDRNSAPAPAYVFYERREDRRVASLDVAAVPPPTPTQASGCSYTSSDLAATSDAPLTQEIQDLAASFGYSPVRIFRHVADTIAFEPYYGSLKGAAGTLTSGSGNATDQASVLIALLRASNVPARYVKGVVRFAVADTRLPRWLGVKTHRAAASILGQGHIPVQHLVDGGGNTIHVDFTHVWAEACVPYGNYRGTGSDLSGWRWVPLDPSFKDHAYQVGIATNVTLNYTAYMALRRNMLPHEQYAVELEAVVKTLAPNFANNTLEDVPYVGVRTPRPLDILPASVPYRVVSFSSWDGTPSGASEVAAIPARHRYVLELFSERGVDGEHTSSLDLLQRWPSISLAMPDAVLKRITLAYKGATPSDQTQLTSWRNNANPDVTLPCTINVTAIVHLEGVEQAWTPPPQTPMPVGPVGVCSLNNRLVMRLTMAELASAPLYNGRVTDETPALGGLINAVTFRGIAAADYHALFAYGFQASDRLLRERAAKLLASVAVLPNPNSNPEESEGELLHLSGLKYMRYITDAGLRIGRLDGASGLSGNHIGLASTRSKVSYAVDQPFYLYRKGFLVDVPGGRSRTVDLSSGGLVWKTFQLTGYASSAYESYLWQENARLDAVSSVRGIQFARETAIPVPTLTAASQINQLCWQGNPSQPSGCPANYLYSVNEKNQILGYLNTGYTVQAPRQLIQYQNWKGSVYITEKNTPTAMSAGFSIAGAYGGGYSVLPSSSSVPQWHYNPTLDTGVRLTDPTSTQVAEAPFVFVADGAAANAGVVAGNTYDGDPVNMVTGNMYHVERDISLKGRGGLPIVFERSYNSLAPQDGPLGFGWTHTFNQYLLFKDDNADEIANAADTDGVTSTVIWVDGTGAQKVIRAAGESTTCGPGPGATFTAPKGFFFTVVRNADRTYTIREKNGLTYTFENVEGIVGAKAKLTRITDRNGNRLTLTYTAGKLTAVTDDLNRALTFTYTGNRIARVADFGGRLHQYTYDAAGNLVTYKNPLAVSGVQNPVTYTYYSTPAALNHAMQSYVLPRGNGMTFEYYANGRVFRHYTTLGETTTFAYNSFRRESTSVNARGFTRRYFFDSFGNATKLVEETGGEWQYTYDTNASRPHNRLSQRNPIGYETKYCYDASGNVTREIRSSAVAAGETCATGTPGAGTVTYEHFNAFNQPGKIKDARGNYTILKYDAKGNLEQSIALRNGVGASVNPTTYTPVAADVVAWTRNTYHPTFGNLLTVKRVRDAATEVGPTLTYTYDAQSLNATTISRAGDKDGNGTIDAPDNATLVYDTLGRVTTGLSADWHTTQFVYDAVGRVVRGTDALGQMRDYGYDANGNAIFTTLVSSGAIVDQRAAGYDLSDRKVATYDAAGLPTTYAYDAAGNVIEVTNPDGYRLRFDYDPNNQVVRAIDERGASVRRTLDLDGKPRTITDPNGNTTTFTYYGPEKEGRLQAKTDALAHATTYDYDAAGNVITITDAAGRVTLTSYDELNRPTRIVGPAYTDPTYGTVRPVTKYTYNLLGFRTQVAAGRTDASGTNPASDVVTPQMTYVWDDFGRKLKETDALNRMWTTTYDVQGNPQTVTDAKSQTTSFTWAYGHQLMTRTAGSHVTTYSRNLLGQVTQVVSPEVTYTHTYDAAHRLASVTDSRGNKTLSYTWSSGGKLNSLLDAEGQRTDYVYDAVGRLAELWAPNGDVVSFMYDAGGRLVEKNFPNGVSARYTYNADNTLQQLVNRHGAGTIITQHDYTYDTVGNRLTHQELINETTTPYKYVYDPLSRLSEVRNNTTNALIESYTYDALGNRLSKTDASASTTFFLYDIANQLNEARQGSPTGPLAMAFVYDANGSLMKKCEGGTVTGSPTACTGSTITDLSYDQLNRTSQIAKTGLATQTYLYDDQGRRIRKTVGGVATNYLYNGTAIHATYSSVWDTPGAKYVHGGGIDTPLIRITSTGKQYFHQDGLGSVVALTSATGAVDGSTRFDAWGNTIASTGSIPVYGYTGREPDETGLIYYRARYYDPIVGLFTQRDPLGMAGGTNAYAYVAGNPLRLTDPMGLLPLDPMLLDDAQYHSSVDGGMSSAQQSFSEESAKDRGSYQDHSTVDPTLEPGQSTSTNLRSMTRLGRGLDQLTNDTFPQDEWDRRVVATAEKMYSEGRITIGRTQCEDCSAEISNDGRVVINQTISDERIAGRIGHEAVHEMFRVTNPTIGNSVTEEYIAAITGWRIDKSLGVKVGPPPTYQGIKKLYPKLP